jgi:hypothetical protein
MMDRVLWILENKKQIRKRLLTISETNKQLVDQVFDKIRSGIT